MSKQRQHLNGYLKMRE